MVHSTRALALAGLITAVFACSSSSEKEDADEGALTLDRDDRAPAARSDGGGSNDAAVSSRAADAGSLGGDAGPLGGDATAAGDSTTDIECTDNAGCPETDDPAICGPAQCIEGRCIFSFC